MKLPDNWLADDTPARVHLPAEPIRTTPIVYKDARGKRCTFMWQGEEYQGLIGYLHCPSGKDHQRTPLGDGVMQCRRCSAILSNNLWFVRTNPPKDADTIPPWLLAVIIGFLIMMLALSSIA